MDEERRTSANLNNVLDHLESFINTDSNLADEIYTSMEAGPMIKKEI